MNYEYIKIEPTYPHNLMMHLNKIVSNNGIQILHEKDRLLELYSDEFKDDFNGLELLKLAYSKNLIEEFFLNSSEKIWRQRVFVEKAVGILLYSVSEKYAVLLVESLMFVFSWKFSVKIMRTGNVPDNEKAMFHEKTYLNKTKSIEDNERIVIKNNDIGKYSSFREISDSESGNIKIGKNSERKNRDSTNKLKKSEKEEIKSVIKKEKQKKKKLQAKENNLKEIVKAEQVKFYTKMNTSQKRTLNKAIKGDAKSQCELGDFYAEKGTEHTDYVEAEKWYKSSHAKGYERAYFELGRMYDQGSSEISDGKEKAIGIYVEMAEKGYSSAQCVLGMKYWFGDGVEEDIKKAAMWFMKAADQKNQTAVRNLADLYNSIHDEKNAMRWYKIGSEMGDNYCTMHLKRKIKT